MAIIKVDYGDIGGGVKCASGYIENMSATVTTTDDATGVAFRPKKIMMFCYINGGASGFWYDEDTDPNSYIRRYNGSDTTINIPNTSYTGIEDITSTGFTVKYPNEITKAYYIAVG